MRIRLENVIARLALAAGVVGVCCLLAVVALKHFVVGTLADRRLAVNRNMLLAPAGYVPNSARVNARLAEAELGELDPDLAGAEANARRAIELSPYDYHNRVVLASVEEARGNRRTAELTLEDARRLAPKNRNVLWRLANVMLRQGKLEESLVVFREALAGDVAHLPGALDLIWRASNERVAAVEAITGDEPRARLTLAQFLVRQSRYSEASATISGIDRGDRLSAPETPRVINSLVAAGQYPAARELWVSSISDKEGVPTLVWNGGFESDIAKNLSQFDWSLSRSEYAKPAIDASSAHGGSRSLKIEFTGRDTTALDNEVRQLVVIQPGARYEAECWVKTSNLESPEAPKLVVSDALSAKWLASSPPIATGSTDWQRIAIEFVAPQPNAAGFAAVHLSVKRKPRFSYDEPTRGTVWFDDFAIRRIE